MHQSISALICTVPASVSTFSYVIKILLWCFQTPQVTNAGLRGTPLDLLCELTLTPSYRKRGKNSDDFKEPQCHYGLIPEVSRVTLPQYLFPSQLWALQENMRISRSFPTLFACRTTFRMWAKGPGESHRRRVRCTRPRCRSTSSRLTDRKPLIKEA